MLNFSAHIYWFTALWLYCWCWFAYTDAHRQALNTPLNNAHEYTNTRDRRHIHIETIYIAVDKIEWVQRAKKRDRVWEIERENDWNFSYSVEHFVLVFAFFSIFFFFWKCLYVIHHCSHRTMADRCLCIGFKLAARIDYTATSHSLSLLTCFADIFKQVHSTIRMFILILLLSLVDLNLCAFVSVFVWIWLCWLARVYN